MRLVPSCAAAALLLLAGCPPPCDQPYDAWAPDFESCGLCGTPSGSGSAAVVDTFHPGERAVALEGPVRLHMPTYELDVGSQYHDGSWIEYLTDCAEPPAMRWLDGGVLEVVVSGDGDTGASLQHVRSSLPPAPEPDGTDPEPDPWDAEAYYVTAVELVTSSGARCTIDELRVMTSRACEVY